MYGSQKVKKRETKGENMHETWKSLQLGAEGGARNTGDESCNSGCSHLSLHSHGQKQNGHWSTDSDFWRTD